MGGKDLITSGGEGFLAQLARVMIDPGERTSPMTPWAHASAEPKPSWLVLQELEYIDRVITFFASHGNKQQTSSQGNSRNADNTFKRGFHQKYQLMREKGK
jgi:hypothetical protein